MLRAEVYGQDGTQREAHPYVVTENRYAVHQLQPKDGNNHGVYLCMQKESLAYHYERNPHDPRIGHQITLKVDDFGNVLQAVAIGYGRRRDDPDPLLTDDDRKKQKHTQITDTENRYTNPIQQEDAYRGPLICETRTYELLNVVPDASGSHATCLLSAEEVLRNLQVAGDGQHDIPYEDVEAIGARKGDPCRHLIEHVRTLYRRDDLTGPLPLGQVQPLALPFESYQLAFTLGLVAGVYGGRITDAILQNEGRYVPSEGDANWWIPAGQVFYSPDSDDTFLQELACARQHFFLPHRFRDPFEQTITVSYDSYDLLVQETRDALGNRVTAGERDPAGSLMMQGNDYRVLQPRLVMDPNRNRSAVAFDTLGLVVGTAVMGKPEESLGDSLDGFAPDLGDAALAAYLQEPLADPHGVLRRATAREEKYATRVHLDIEANEREIIDTQGRLAMRYDYDMLGNKIHQASMEASERWSLHDVTGRRLHDWDSRGHTLRTVYDALRRPAEVFLGEGAGPELLVERTVYGETQASPEASNLRAKVHQVCDGAGWSPVRFTTSRATCGAAAASLRWSTSAPWTGHGRWCWRQRPTPTTRPTTRSIAQ